MKGGGVIFKNSKLFKRIVSGLSAAVMFMSNTLPLVPLTVGAENAHTINVFDITLTRGANHVTDYTADDGITTVTDGYVWTADKPDVGHEFEYNIMFSMSGEGYTNDDKVVEIWIPAHILKATPHKDCCADTQLYFSSDHLNPTQEYCRISRRIWVI